MTQYEFAEIIASFDGLDVKLINYTTGETVVWRNEKSWLEHYTLHDVFVRLSREGWRVVHFKGGMPEGVHHIVYAQREIEADVEDVKIIEHARLRTLIEQEIIKQLSEAFLDTRIHKADLDE